MQSIQQIKIESSLSKCIKGRPAPKMTKNYYFQIPILPRLPRSQ